MSERRKIASSIRRWNKASVPLILGAGLLVILALLAARPLYRRYQAFQAADMLRRARSASEQQDWQEALRLCGESLHLQGTPEAFLLAADTLIAAQAPPDEILETLQQARDMGNRTPELLLKIARAQIDRGDLLAAQTVLSSVPAAARSTWQAIEVEGAVLIALGREREAATRMRELLSADLSAPGATFRIAAIDLEDATLAPGQRDAARRRLWEEARAKTALAAIAIRLLAENPVISASEAHELFALSEQLGPRGSDLRFTAMGAILRTDDKAEKQAFLLRQSALAAEALPEDHLRYLKFLAANEQPQALLDHLRKYRGRFPRLMQPEVPNMELEALAQTQQWTLVLQRLDSREAPRFDAVLDNLWRACALHATRPADPQIPLCLQAAYEATGRGRQTAPTLRIADTAARLNQSGFASRCYETLIAAARLPAERIILLQKACAAMAQTPDTADLLRFARQLADLTPGHEDNAYRADYQALLTRSPDLHAIAMRLSAEEGLSVAQTARRRLLLALLIYQRSTGASIAKELNGIEQATIWTAGERAVLAGLLAAAGETARAFALAEQVPDRLLLPEEAALLKLAR